MEIHRLKQMPEGYSEELFNRLYKETKQLKKSLVYGIDHRRYGVTKDIIESWFDDKFIHVFSKHCHQYDENVLKGFIINSLKKFKFRILRAAYTDKAELYSNQIELEGEFNLINYLPDTEDISNGEVFYGLVSEFFRKHLSDNAYMLLELQLNPPPFLINQVNRSTSTIPAKLILEFFGLDNIPKNLKMVRSLRKEISNAIEKAREELNPELAF